VCYGIEYSIYGLAAVSWKFKITFLRVS